MSSPDPEAPSDAPEASDPAPTTTTDAVRKALLGYRIMAWTTGVWLIALCYEMVMKSATVGIGIVAAISAPTALAIALAQEANVTLIGFARPDGYSIYSHAQRVDSTAQRNRSAAS